MALDFKSITAIAVGILSILLLLWRKADVALDPREPPIALSKVPFFGHIFGMIRYQIKYFEMLSHNDHPIFSIKIFNTRIYVVKSPQYVALAFKETKTLRFDVFTTEFLRNGLDGPQSIVDIFETTTYLSDIHTHTYSVLSIGPDLTESNARVLNVVSRYMVPQETNLYAFLRETYTIAAGETLYGPNNPVPGLIDEIWDFEENIGLMMMGFSTTITARKAYRAQKRYSKAFKAYYDAGLEKNGNTLVSGRARIARNHNMDNTALGIFEMAISFAAVTNVVPTVFWMLSYIYTNADLLQDLREEVTILGNPLDVTKLRSCPLLVSTFQETLRLTQHGNAVRLVTADTQLGDFLLKKGSIVQMPAAVLNKATSTWGPDSKEFNPRRFLDIGDKKARQYGFSPFGGGKHLCPGRHLAFTEALGLVATFVSGFDMEGAKVIGTRTHKMGSGTKKPAGDVKVSITPRKGYENRKWTFNVGSEKEAGSE